jgi:aldose 1-epimerase
VATADGPDTVAIESSELQAMFVRSAGMVCCSLRHDGVELLCERRGVRAYAEHGSTMGIPLLYPWANRLAGFSYAGAGAFAPVELSRASPLFELDANGLPIHGAIARNLSWELLDPPATDRARSLRACMRWERPELLAIFPFTHRLELAARVDGGTLTIETVVRASGAAPVPVSFGYHPYLTIPGVDRSTWQVELPVTERLLLDDRMIPTGERETFDRRRLQLADSDWDDALAGLIRPAVFAVSAGRRRIELELLEGYRHAQVFAPRDQSFICFEPMTAPTNALVSGDELPIVAAGGSFRAAFRISVCKARA